MQWMPGLVLLLVSHQEGGGAMHALGSLTQLRPITSLNFGCKSMIWK